MANLLTSVRILCALLILRFPAFSKWYYVFYLMGGFTDAVDGMVARFAGTESVFGAKYDTAADLIFSIAVFGKLIHSVMFPVFLLLWVSFIFVIKTSTILFALIRYKQFPALHSPLNKVCGAVCYLPPIFLGSGYGWKGKMILLVFICLLATVAAAEEGIKVFKGRILE